MKNKIYGLLLATIFLLVITSLFASATISLLMQGNQTFATSSIVQGILSVNITIYGSGVNVNTNMTNCSIWGKSNALTANTTYTQIANLTGTGGKLWAGNGTLDNDTNFTIIWNTAMFEDANDYKFKAICSNSTDGTTLLNVSSSEITGLTIDNTEPATPSALSPSEGTIDTDNTLDFSASVTNSRTTSCTLYFPNENPGRTSYSMTYSGSSCTHQLTDVPEQTYRYYIQASDESNTTDSSTTTLQVDVKTSATKVPALLQQEGVTSKGGALLSVAIGNGNNWLRTPTPIGELWFVIVLVLAVIVIIFLVRMKR